jgi:hypothetical protein
VSQVIVGSIPALSEGKLKTAKERTKEISTVFALFTKVMIA